MWSLQWHNHIYLIKGSIWSALARLQCLGEQQRESSKDNRRGKRKVYQSITLECEKSTLIFFSISLTLCARPNHTVYRLHIIVYGSSCFVFFCFCFFAATIIRQKWFVEHYHNLTVLRSRPKQLAIRLNS